MADPKPGLTIGVSGPTRQRPAQRLIRIALALAGANTVYIRPGAHIDVGVLDGLVLSGGTHVHPGRYSQKPLVRARYDIIRDDTDWHLLLQARHYSMPVLGICRGAQLINVFRNGTLYQDITPLRRHTRHRPLLLPLQTVRVVRDTRLARILETQVLGANRIHSQTISRLGDDLKVTALDHDFFVQAIESTDRQWILGVQWHPEYLLYHSRHRRIFERFVETVRERKLKRLGHAEGPTF
ncbi:putative glutamine amidotransferase [Tamilnaduibacter salinus]|uniref:Peptidase C26 n=1 Tax=Tamilnaduibacter salinus TaxID=1484056 RepID=A0A2A2I3K4_9GAMM|nr:gamma-glutamyl-gamma-aminobutyrate hydrolase family protein [Tamilnaduibacter salinus]PAV25690.1 peptidase C26 [Tamilnaduibacter salinus]PVY79234.1 putative glutamine amidotransferase [Tamilnaduibacter salinus]